MSRNENWAPPKWMYRETTPEKDSAFFENLTHCIFQAGLNWKVIENKWPNFMKAFENFDVNIVSKYENDDVKRLLNDAGIVRNKNKILAAIHNAKEFKRIAEEQGSFSNWLGSLNKSNNYKFVVKKLQDSFKHVGPSTAHIFLFSVGEDIKYDESVHGRRPR
jgi:DNA-3-methyladenine glycosylase I